MPTYLARFSVLDSESGFACYRTYTFHHYGTAREWLDLEMERFKEKGYIVGEDEILTLE